MTTDHSYWSDTFKPVGGDPALDFVNTVGNRLSDAPDEHVETYADLVLAAERIGVIGADEASRLRAAAERSPDAAEAVRERAVALREHLHAVLGPLAGGTEGEAGALARFNEALAPSLSHLRVVRAGDGGFVWAWEASDDVDLGRVLWPFARAGAEMLVSDRLGRLRVCDDDDCGWLFLDLSRNRSRRWCDMADCGNRAKARRFQARQADRSPG